MTRTATQTADLFLLEDLEDAAATSTLAEGELAALRMIADWIATYVLEPHEELIGRGGPVCPFLPASVERRSLWLAAEQVADRDVSEVVELMRDYQRRLLEAEPHEGDGVNYNVIAVVFTDLPPDRAQGLFGEVTAQLGIPAYAEHGVLFGPYYEGNAASAIYKASFQAFESPVPFLFVRHGVVADWKFFIDDEEWFGLWAHRYGESGAHALAAEVRRLPWRVAEGTPG